MYVGSFNVTKSILLELNADKSAFYAIYHESLHLKLKHFIVLLLVAYIQSIHLFIYYWQTVMTFNQTSKVKWTNTLK